MKRATWLLLALVGASSASAQVSARWPRLRAGEDTNDAAAYVQLARTLLISPADTANVVAAAALRWAARLDPGSADPPYLMAVTTLRPIFRAFWQSRGSRRLLRRELTPEVSHRVDSLLREAWLREPFYDIDLEPLLAFGWGQLSEIPRGDPIERGYAAYFNGALQLAADSWGRALASAPRRLDLHLHRAHSFYALGRYDSTVAALQAALAVIAPSESAQSVLLPPTHVLYYAIGVVQERAGHADEARDAYSRALLENLGLYMAQVRLAGLFLAAGDTAAGLGQVALAVSVAPREPWLLSYYGYVLLLARRYADAVVQLQAATAIDSDYATPYYLLGMAHDALTEGHAALAQYEAFLVRAPVFDARRPWTVRRVAELRGALKGSPRPHD